MLDQHLHGSWTRLLFTENSHYKLPWGPNLLNSGRLNRSKLKKTLAATCVNFQVTRKLWSGKHCRIRGFVSNITASMKQMLDQMLGDGVIVVCCSDAIFNLHMGGVMEGPITFTWNKKWRQKTPTAKGNDHRGFKCGHTRCHTDNPNYFLPYKPHTSGTRLLHSHNTKKSKCTYKHSLLST